MSEKRLGGPVFLDQAMLDEVKRQREIEEGMRNVDPELREMFNRVKSTTIEGSSPLRFTPVNGTHTYGSQFRPVGAFVEKHRTHLPEVIDHWGTKVQGTYVVEAGNMARELAADILLDGERVVSVTFYDDMKGHLMFVPDGTPTQVLENASKVLHAVHHETHNENGNH